MLAAFSVRNDSSINVITCYVVLLHDRRPGFHSCLSQGLGGHLCPLFLKKLSSLHRRVQESGSMKTDLPTFVQ